MFQYGIFCNTKGNHFCKSETVASFMLYFELNFTHNILHIVDTRLFTLYKLSSLYSTYCKNFLTMGRMSKFNNFVLSCKNNFVVTDNSTTSYSRKTKLFSIFFSVLPDFCHKHIQGRHQHLRLQHLQEELLYHLGHQSSDCDDALQFQHQSQPDIKHQNTSLKL